MAKKSKITQAAAQQNAGYSIPQGYTYSFMPVQYDAPPANYGYTPEQEVFDGKKKKEAKRRGPIGGLCLFIAAIFTLLAIIAPLINYVFRDGYVFINNEIAKEAVKLLKSIPSDFPYSSIIFYLMLANAAFDLILLFLWCKKKHLPLIFSFFFTLSMVFTVFYLLVDYVSSIIAHPAEFIDAIKYLPFAVLLVAIPFLLLWFPTIKFKKTKGVFAVLVSVLLIAGCIASWVYGTHLKFEFAADAAVLDVGETGGIGYYSVIFATNEDSIGWVTIEDDPDVYWSADAGVKRVGKIHAVKIPYSYLDNKTYQIHAFKYSKKLSYDKIDFSKGTIISGNEIDFAGDYALKDNLNIALYSDWHERVTELGAVADSDAMAKNGAIDLIVYGGDYANFYVNEQDFIDYFLKGAAAASKGAIPGIFVRGNHEVRADFNEMNTAYSWLGLKSFYYQIKRGNYQFTVLDSAETYGGDYWEHDGQYDMNAYQKEQMDWFDKYGYAAPGVFNVVLTHSSEFTGQSEALPSPYDALSTQAEVLRARYFAGIKRNNVDLTLSGHSHTWASNKPLADGETYAYLGLNEAANALIARGVVDLETIGLDVENAFAYTNAVTTGGKAGGTSTEVVAILKKLISLDFTEDKFEYGGSNLYIANGEIEFRYINADGEEVNSIILDKTPDYTPAA
ncbi:MAG: metallophosphoesterase [Christensenellaceae bacterium]|jgi:predicted MPP superfamily phosphohydrolase|nr:metallophosphoesterase [Christensenellaceae bacterium]